MVRVFVASEADEASRNQRDALLALAPWQSDATFGGQASWRWREPRLNTIPENYMYRDSLDRDSLDMGGCRLDLVVSTANQGSGTACTSGPSIKRSYGQTSRLSPTCTARASRNRGSGRSRYTWSR